MGKAFKINVRAFKLLYERYPQMMLSRLFTEIWNSLTPYVGIYLSALIIGELAGCRWLLADFQVDEYTSLRALAEVPKNHCGKTT